MGTLTPVDFDPFAPSEAAGATVSSGGTLTPVSYDPFAPQEQQDPETTILGEIGEVGRGIPAGAVESVGTALRGISANQPTERFASYLDEIEQGVRYRTREREGRVPISDDQAYTDILGRIADDPGMFQSQQLWLRNAIEKARAGDPSGIAEARARLPSPAVQDRDLWRAGEAVSEFARENFPAKPGYEETLGRAIGEGLGSLGAGIATAMVPGAGPALSTTFFTAMGMGEAADRAVAAGATDEQIVRAAGYGAGPGATDIIPAEMLLGRIPGANVIANAAKRFGGKRVMQALGRIGNQAIVESVQEGGQQVLQNLIAREVHSPETQVLEGVVENSGIGGIVGGIAGLGREGVHAIGGRRSRSARGERARAVREVPPPSADDEASPIATADIMEGRERVADAQAAETTNKWLETAGLPKIGQPVRVIRGRDTMEGVVTDAWSGDEPGITVEAPDGTLLDATLAELQNMGASIQTLPMPAPRAEIEKAAQDIASDAEQVRRERQAAQERGGAPTPERRREIDQIMADVRTEAAQRGEPAPPAPEAALPRLTREQGDEVARLTRAGVPPGEAVRQVTRAGVPPGGLAQDLSPGGVPPGGPAFTREPGGVPPGGAALDLSPEGVPPGGPAQDLSPGGVPDGDPFIPVTPTAEGFGDVARDPMAGTGPRRRATVTGPSGRPEPDAGPTARPAIVGPQGRRDTAGPETRPVVIGPGGRVETGGPDSRPIVIGPSGRPDDAGPETRPVVVGPGGFVESGGPDSRPLIVGPQGRVEPMGPDTRPVVVGPQGRPETSGPERRPLVIGPSGFVETGTGPDRRPLVIGPNGRVETGGPDSRPVVVGPSGRLQAQGPETRPQVTGPQGRRGEQGPQARPVVIGPSGRMETAGPDSRPVVVGPDGFAEPMGPDTRPVVVGPSGRLETMGPDSRPIVIGPDGRIDPTQGPPARPEVVGPAGRRDATQGPPTRPRMEHDRRRRLMMTALPRKLSSKEIDAAAQEVGLPPETSVQMAEQVADGLRTQRDDVTPTPDMVAREVQATGLPADFAERIAAKVAERQGMLPEPLGEAQERAPREVTRIADRTDRPATPEERELPTGIQSDSNRTPEREPLPEGLPEGFADRIAARVAAVPEVQGLPEGSRERVAQAVADAMERVEGLPQLDPISLAERIEALPEVQEIPPETRRRMAAAAAVEVKRSPGIPERTTPPPEARTPEGLPEDFGATPREVEPPAGIPEEVRSRVVELPELQRIPPDMAQRIADRVAGIPEISGLGEPPPVTRPDLPRLPADFAARIQERVDAIPEITRIPVRARERVAEKVAEAAERLPDAPAWREAVMEVPEVRRLPEGMRERLAARVADAAARVAGLPSLGEPAEGQPPETRRLPEGFAERIRERVEAIPELRMIPAGARERMAARVVEMVEPPDVRPGTGAPSEESAALPAGRGQVERAEGEEGGSPDRASPPPPITPETEAIEAAEAETETEPTDGQKQAGNYRKGKFTLHGMEISVENPKGSERSGVGRDGRPWSVTLPATYGYIRRTEGADGDQVDVYVGPEPESQEVFVVDQVDADSRAFDEHKVMMGYPSQEAALADYDAAFNDGRGPERRGAVTPMSLRGFRNWLENGDTKQPLNRELAGPSGPPTRPRIIRRKDGEPFKTRQGAVLAARSRKIEGEPVEVEGGWAIETAMEQAEQAMPAEPDLPEVAPETPETAPEGAAPPPILRNDGSPFKTRQGAALAARSKKIEGAEPVEVEGGWAIQPAMPAEPAPMPEPSAAPAPDARPVETATPEKPEAPVPVAEGLYEFTPADLNTDARAFQYKSGGDDTGVTERLQGVKKWDPLKAGIAIVYERKSGERVIADGHQRLGLAKRMAAEGQDPRILGRLVREVDGYTVEDVREMAALKNIAEGTGDAFDAATVLRDSSDPQEALSALPPQSSLVRNAKDIARLEPGPFRAAKAAGLPAGTVGVVGRVAEGDAPLQQALIEEFSARPPPNVAQAEAMARMFREDRTANVQVADLFGESEVATSLYRERARIIDGAIRRLKSDKRVFGTLAKNAEQIQAAGNVLAADNEALADAAGRGAYLVQQLATRTGPVADAVKAAAQRVNDGENYSTATTAVVEAIREWARTESGALGAAGLERGAPDEGGRQPGPPVPEREDEARRDDEGDPDEVVVLPGQGAMFQRAPGPVLRATHGLSINNLRSAVERGTLVAPSVAVTPAEVPHQWGGPGNVEVIFKANAIDPKRWGITEGDAWTPTYPKVERRIKTDRARRAASEAIDRDFAAVDQRLKDAMPGYVKDTLERHDPGKVAVDSDGGIGEDRRSDTDSVLTAIYLQEQGRSVADEAEYREATYSPEFEEWKGGYLKSLPGVEEVFFGGYTPSGNRRYMPATTANALKDMKRQAREEGESVSFGGHGQVWARWRPQVRTKAQMREAAARVTRDEEAYEKQKDELTQEILDIGTQIAQAVGRTGAMDFDTGLNILLEAGPNEARLNRVASEYSLDGEPVELPSYLIDEIREHFDKVAEMPLQFLEAKRIAEVPMSDVAAVVVPKGTFPQSLRQRLEDQGIEVREKHADMTDEELAEVQSIPSALFKRAPVGEKTPEERPPPPQVRIRLAKRFDAEKARIADDIKLAGRETFGERFRVELAESITPPDGSSATGAFDPANRIAYIALRADQDGMTGALWHEGLHYLRQAGAFSKADGSPSQAWQTLEGQAAQWRKDYGIDERYGPDVEGMDAGQRERLLNEEAVAEALADYAVRGRDTGFKATVRATFNRILRFFRAVRAGLQGRGFQTWEDVFEGIGRGEAGRRADAAQPQPLTPAQATAFREHAGQFEFNFDAPVVTPERRDQGGARPAPERRVERLTQTRLVSLESARVGVTRIESPEDAAHVFAPFRKEPTESLIAAAVDADGKVLGLIRHSVGTTSSTPVELGVLAGSVLQVPGAKGFWVSHQHPSGVTFPSKADQEIARTLMLVTKDTGLDYHGAFVVAPGQTKATFMPPSRLRAASNKEVDIRPAARRATVPVFTRRWQKVSPAEKRPRVGDYNQANAVAREHLPEHSGLLLLDTKNHLVGAMTLGPTEMANMRRSGTARDLMQAIAETNATSAVGMLPEGPEATEAARNMLRFGRDIGQTGGFVVHAVHEIAGDGTMVRAHARDDIDAAGVDRYLQVAWHASPHRFDRFSTEHIGSGEGAQVYGWGLYFADKKGVAEWYQQNFERDLPLKGVRVAGTEHSFADNGVSAARAVVEAAGGSSEVAQEVGRRVGTHTAEIKTKRDLVMRIERALEVIGDAQRAQMKERYRNEVPGYSAIERDIGLLSQMTTTPTEPKKPGQSIGDMGTREAWENSPLSDEAVSRLFEARPRDKRIHTSEMLRVLMDARNDLALTRPEIAAEWRTLNKLLPAARRQIDAAEEIASERKAPLYRVDLAPKDSEYLHWDRKLADQPRKVRKAIERLEDDGDLTLVGEDVTGGEIYRALAEQNRSQEIASRDLLSSGIRGIKYLDQSSRPMVSGFPFGPTRARMPLRETFNYVIFDDSDVAIEEIMLQRQRSHDLFDDPRQTELPGTERLPERGVEAARARDREQSQELLEDVFGAETVRRSDKLRSTKPQEGVEGLGLFDRQQTLFQRGDNRSAEFKRWFGQSKVVTRDGSPKVVYHGTGRDVAAFEPGRSEIENTGGFYFTDSPSLASGYATGRGRGPQPNVMPVYLSIQNPKRVQIRDHTDASVSEHQTRADVASALAEGHDGVEVIYPRGLRVWVAFRPEQIKSATGNRGTFDIESPNILFQRGASEDPKAFDRAATDEMGVNLDGAAEAVVKDKDRMGGLAEEIKAGLKGTTAIQDPKVEVTEEKTHKDLILAWRYLAPQLAWSKKFPAIHELIKQGVKTEKEMSIFIQRLNRDWDRITKKLNKDEFSQLTGILFLGDADQVTFTDEQLGKFNTTQKVRAAYRESRKYLDKLGRYTEQHERAMALPLMKRRTTLVRQMAGERGMDRSAFRSLYDARAKLMAQQRAGGADPRNIEFQIAEATETLYGGQEPPSDVFLDRLKEVDKIETRIADTKVRRREGYVPHKFFGKWRIFQKAQPDDEVEPYMGRGGTGFKDRKAAEKAAAASEGGLLEGATPVEVDGKWGLEPKWKEVAGEHGLWKTRTDAVRAASHIARNTPGAELLVLPREFVFPEDQATTLSDGGYFRFLANVEQMTGLKGEALREVVAGAARRPFRRRIAGFLQYRTGMTGYSLDLDRVMRTHVGETVRYASLDQLKFDAINTMEKEGLSSYYSAVQDRPVLAAAVQAWFRDVNGQKQQLESQIDNVLNKSWVTPLRAGLAAGALGFLASGGPFNAPISPIVGAYVGYRVGRGLAQGGDFATRSITGSMLGDMAHLKLGAVFNLMSALVNTSQVALNTYPVLGTRDAAVGFKRYNKAVLSRLRGKPNADWRFLERMDINPLDTFAEGTRHKFKKESKLSKVSMVFFSTAEGFNRGVTALGALNKAQRKGWSHKKAKDYANETLDRTQFHYGASDKPELLRNVLLRVPLQFKNFVAHQLTFVFGLRGAEIPRFLLAMVLLGGGLGIPGLDFIDTLTDWLFDFSPIAAMKGAALDAAVEGELVGGIATFLTRGVPGLAGVDMSGRVGMGDKFLPLQLRDWKGPWISTVENAVRHGKENASWQHQMRNLSPGLGNPLVVLDAWQNGGQMSSPWKRGRPEYRATGSELALKLAGARPIREARLQDLRDVERRNIEDYRVDTRRYVDQIVAALERGDRIEARTIMQDALDAGVSISSNSIRRAIQDMGTQRALREFDRLPRSMKPEGMQRREAIERRAAQ